MRIPGLRLIRLICLLCSLFCTGYAAADEVPITEEARAHFTAGVNFMQDPDGARYEEAYREFRAAYASSPSWKILGNLGICAMKLERDGEAIDVFERYLKEGGENLDEAERAQFTRDLQTLRTGVVMVTLSSVPPGALIADQRVPVQGSPVTNRYQLGEQPITIGIRAGHHKVTASLEGRPDVVWEFDAVSGSTLSHSFEIPEAAPPTAPSPAPSSAQDPGASRGVRPITTGVYVGLAATGLFTVGAGVVGFLALNEKSEYEDINDGSDPEEARSLQDSTKTLNLVTDIFIGTAVLSAAVTTYLYVSRPTVQVGQDQARLRVDPLLGLSAGGLVLSGAF